MDADTQASESFLSVELQPSSPSDSSPKRKRGRPRKTPLSLQHPDNSAKRKRGRPPKTPPPPPIFPASEENPPTPPAFDENLKENQHENGIFVVDSLKKKRGRPRKDPSPSISLNSSVKRKRGRPSKNSVPLLFVPSGTPDIIKKKPGRPRLNPVAGISGALEEATVHSEISGIQEEKRGSPSINPDIVLSLPSPASSDIKKKRGRPRLKTVFHSNIVKKRPGRPPKYPSYRLLELAAIKKKKGKPLNSYSTRSTPNLGNVEEAERTEEAKSQSVPNIQPNGSSGKQRGRPPKHVVHFENENDITGKGEWEMPGKASYSAELTNFVRSGAPGKATLQSSMFCEEDLMMEEVVKRLPFMDTVVKVFCVHTEPNYSLPWQMKRQVSSSSSGFIISGRRVLTNAHSVQNHTQVKVKKRGSDTKYLATVLAIGTECDIALLTVKDDTFWEGVCEVKFGGLPSLQDAVTVVGYPIGGDTISVASGIVSRIEVTSYAHGATELLGVQIDAAINAGNSGGPAFNAKGLCVGIAFQALKQEDAENIGYIIPTPVISHFIDDYERNGHYTGFPILGIDWQKLENPDLRKSLGMEPHQKGVLIRRVEPTAPAAKCLQPTDIVSSFNEIDVANDGTVPFRHGERIGFSYLVSQKFTGEKATVKILRGKKVLEFAIQLETQKRVVPVHIKGLPPSYFIIAGIVFVAVSVPYLRSEYGKDYNYDAPVKLLDKLLHSMAQSEDEQLVVISQVLVADINIGYEDIVNTQIIALNGVPVKNLKHLAHMVENCEERFLKFDLEYDQILVLETKKAKEATQDILATHCIPSATSEDLK